MNQQDNFDPALVVFAEHVFDIGKRRIKKKGGTDTLLVLAEGAKEMVVPLHYENRDEKLLATSLAQAIIHALGVSRYGIVSEAWQSKDPQHPGPANDPLRREVLMASATTPAGSMLITAPFDRTGRGRVKRFGNKSFAEGRGRFAELSGPTLHRGLTPPEYLPMPMKAVIVTLVRRWNKAERTR